MSANIITPTKEEWDILSTLLGELGEGGVIVAPDVVEKLNKKGIEIESYDESYDYGGEADIWLDVAYDEDHLFVTELRKEEEFKETDSATEAICDRCGQTMSSHSYKRNQGLCDKCIEEIN